MTSVVFNGSKSWAHNLNDLRERWQLRREDPTDYVVPVVIFKKDIAKLCRDDLLKLSVDLIKLLNKAKIEKKRIANKPLNKNIDYYLDLQNTINSIGMHVQQVNHALSKTINPNKMLTPTAFVEVCREKLPEDLFNLLMEEAKTISNCPYR